jgi:hypothetical protein
MELCRVPRTILAGSSLVTNDPTADIDWATTGLVPFVAPDGSDRYLNSLGGRGSATRNAVFAHGFGGGIKLGVLDLFRVSERRVPAPVPLVGLVTIWRKPFHGVCIRAVWSKELATCVRTHAGALIVVHSHVRRGALRTTKRLHQSHLSQFKRTAAPWADRRIALGLDPMASVR